MIVEKRFRLTIIYGITKLIRFVKKLLDIFLTNEEYYAIYHNIHKNFLNLQ